MSLLDTVPQATRHYVPPTGPSVQLAGPLCLPQVLLPATYFSATPRKMAGPWIITLLCGLLGATLVQANVYPPAVLNLGPEVIQKRK